MPPLLVSLLKPAKSLASIQAIARHRIYTVYRSAAMFALQSLSHDIAKQEKIHVLLLFATLWNKVPHIQAKLCFAMYTCKLPVTEAAGVYNPESWFALFGLSLSDWLIFMAPLLAP